MITLETLIHNRELMLAEYERNWDWSNALRCKWYLAAFNQEQYA